MKQRRDPSVPVPPVLACESDNAPPQGFLVIHLTADILLRSPALSHHEARRSSETEPVSCTWPTASRRRAGRKSFPPPPPSDAMVAGEIGHHPFQPGILLFQAFQPFRLIPRKPPYSFFHR